MVSLSLSSKCGVLLWDKGTDQDHNRQRGRKCPRSPYTLFLLWREEERKSYEAKGQKHTTRPRPGSNFLSLIHTHNSSLGIPTHKEGTRKLNIVFTFNFAGCQILS